MGSFGFLHLSLLKRSQAWGAQVCLSYVRNHIPHTINVQSATIHVNEALWSRVLSSQEAKPLTVRVKQEIISDIIFNSIRHTGNGRTGQEHCIVGYGISALLYIAHWDTSGALRWWEMIAAPSDDTAELQMIQRSFARGLSANHSPDHAKKTRLLPEQFTSRPNFLLKKGCCSLRQKRAPKNQQTPCDKQQPDPHPHSIVQN